MKKITILLFSCLFHVFVSAQLKEIFKEDFSSNKNKWITGEIENLSVKIENGKYIIDSKMKNSVTPQVLAGVDSSKDFTIGASIKSISENGTAVYGLIFGSNKYAYYCFTANNKGEYILFYVTNNRLYEIIPLSKTAYLKQGLNQTNRLEVKKSGKLWKLFINDSLVNSTVSRKFYGPFIGVSVENMKTEFDDIKITGTSVITSGNLCTLFPLIFNSAKNNFDYIKGDPLKKGDTSNYYSSIQIPGAIYTTIIYSTFGNLFATTLEIGRTKAGIIKYTDSLATQLKQCLPNFVYTKTLDKTGLPKYEITEKPTSPGKQPIVSLYAIGTEFSADFNVKLSFYADPVKNTEPPPFAVLTEKEQKALEKAPTSGWIVNDQFKSNDDKWIVDSSDLIDYKIFKGEYRMENKSDVLRTSLNTFRVNDNDSHDYKIETVVQNLYGKDDELFGLVFGQHFTSGFYFLVTNDGYYKIVQVVDTVVTIIQDLRFASVLLLNDQEKHNNKKVKLCVLKLKDTWKFLINDREVYSCKARHLGEKFGYLIPAKSIVYTDFFKIYDWTVADKLPKESKEVIYANVLIDNFFTNENNLTKNKWSEVNDKNVECSFAGRFYDIENKNSEHYLSLHEISSDNTADYRIELLTSHLGGAKDKPFGLCFAASDTSNAFLFTINSKRMFSVSKFINGIWSSIKETEFSDAISPEIYDSNYLLFEQTKGKWNFYINGRLVYTCNSSMIPGNKVGCYVEGEQRARFEHITYDRIEYR